MSEKHLQTGLFLNLSVIFYYFEYTLLVFYSIFIIRTGDALPPYSGNLRLFASRFCPFAERVVLVLNAKNIKHDLVYINLDQKPEWIFNYSPKGK